jgi:hypothetical protein
MKDDFTSKDYIPPEEIPIPELRRIQKEQAIQAARDKKEETMQKEIATIRSKIHAIAEDRAIAAGQKIERIRKV